MEVWLFKAKLLALIFSQCTLLLTPIKNSMPALCNITDGNWALDPAGRLDPIGTCETEILLSYYNWLLTPEDFTNHEQDCHSSENERDIMGHNGTKTEMSKMRLL